MAAVDIGIGHYYHFMVSQLAEVQHIRVFFSTHRHPKGRIDVPYFLAFEYPVLHSFLDIQDFSPEGKDGLYVPVAAGNCGSTCGISLDEEEFAFFRIPVGTVGKLARKPCASHDGLALHHFTCLPCRMPCRSREYHLVYDKLGLARILFKIILQSSGSRLRYSRIDLAVPEFRLRLTFKLRLSHLDGNHGRKPFAEIRSFKLEFQL